VERYDLVSVAGLPVKRGAAQAAYFGKRVAMIEREPNVDGAGINRARLLRPRTARPL
jgi:hypothetical protein